jgi:pSer/pThr/pTyr-binding forkhead associated (FHA) protein
LTSNEVPGQDAPLLPDSAPFVQLIIPGPGGMKKRVRCRRVVTLIGTRPGCKVNVSHKRVSPVHIAIVNDGESARAADLVTPHGSLLNDLKMEHEILKDGDRLSFGSWEFGVDIQRGTYGGPGDADLFGLDPAPHVFALEHIATKRILQPTRAICTIGRRNGCDIAISDNRISRVHAILFRYYGQPVIFDLLSKHGTFVNEERVGFKVLQNDDILTIGGSHFQVRLAGSPVGEAAPKNEKQIKHNGSPVSEPPPDLIDIGRTEGSQRWRVAENLEKASRRR